MPLKILLADDSMTAQNMGKKILTDAGYEVVAVSNGAAAVKKIAEISPHLCILDIYMPGYTGLEVCEKVKASSATARMPVLLTVGKMEPYKPEEGARVRADGVIVKPFEASELLRAVQRFSQRVGVVQARSGASTAPIPVPAATPNTYERTVKLTREQMQEIMDPSLARWQTGAHTGEVVTNSVARIDVPVEVANVPAINVEDVVATTSMASTADSMPTFAAALADDDVLVGEIEARTAAVPQDEIAAALQDLANQAQDPQQREEQPSAPVAAGSEETAVAANEITPQPEEPVVIHSVEGVHSTGAEILTDELPVNKVEEEIPAVDPSLELAPSVPDDAAPDPNFENAQEIAVSNASEEGLQPTSRAAESEGVVTSADPNLAPMEGLVDAVQPLEGGMFQVPEPKSFPANGSGDDEQPVTEEIAAVLSMLGQTIATEVPTAALDSSGEGGASAEEGALASPAGRVWMAEEVGLTDAESALSLENEMRVAEAGSAAETQPEAATATALAEEPVREDKHAPNTGVPPSGAPLDPAASPTQQLAAAMAAAFGGALPQEDLDRAEATQSISEEVRRFAMGDAYKAKPGFSGAAVEDAGEKSIDPAKLTAAIGRALDRVKPQLVAEILKELEASEQK